MIQDRVMFGHSRLGISISLPVIVDTSEGIILDFVRFEIKCCRAENCQTHFNDCVDGILFDFS